MKKSSSQSWLSLSWGEILASFSTASKLLQNALLDSLLHIYFILKQNDNCNVSFNVNFRLQKTSKSLAENSKNPKLKTSKDPKFWTTSKKYKNGSIFKCFIGTELKPSYFLPRNKFLTGILNFMQLKMHKNPGSTLKIRLHCNRYSHLGTLNRNMS